MNSLDCGVVHLISACLVLDHKVINVLLLITSELVSSVFPIF